MMRGAFAQLSQPIALMVLLPASVAWTTMIAIARFEPMASICFAPRASVSSLAADAIWVVLSNIALGSLIFSAYTMAVAMALPLAWQPATYVLSRSFRGEGTGHVVVFLLAFSVIWTVVIIGLAGSALILRAELWTMLPAPVVACLMTVLVTWHRTSRFSVVALRRCHQSYPLRAFAPGSFVDAGKFGLHSALACARLCWPAMLLPWFSRWPVAVMAGVTLLAFYDRTTYRASFRVPLLVLSALAIAELLVK
jgi:hypothetical protein